MADNNIMEIWNQFKELTTNEMVGAVKRGMRKAANEIKKDTKQIAKAGIKTYNNHQDDYPGNILDAVRVTRLQDNYDEDEMYMWVHVKGYRQPPNKTFRFRFLEVGTKDRYATTRKGQTLNKPRYLGRIQPRKYFQQAINGVDIESIYLQEIEKAVEKINR